MRVRPDGSGSLHVLGGHLFMMVHSGSVCLWLCLLAFSRECLCLIAVDYQTQSLVGQRSSVSFLASCTPLVI